MIDPVELRDELAVTVLLFVEKEEGVPVDKAEDVPVIDTVARLLGEAVRSPVPDTEAVRLLEDVPEAVTVGVVVGVLNWEGVLEDVTVGRAVQLPVAV